MSQQEDRVADSHFSDRRETPASELDTAGLSAARARAVEEAGHSIARQLNGPLTALLLYIEELRQHSHRFSPEPGQRDHLQKVVENAWLQTERVCALVKQVGGTAAVALVPARGGWRERSECGNQNGRPPVAVPLSDAGQKPLTRREREVLNLISEGYSNKQGALRMQISPRTFESHRAEAMRKLGARNTADLVRAALLHPID
ncbi:MAG TPA: helix-turn-helix transcriptional regulator [Bradyrhizobium sp.]|uniref:helix-turn-helix transcriptional regulator n=1 Tax=Bradyrhizobium sp. TaxID=376 RepID=UPI002C8A6980|nr:helix-turn-helix transcriptional regulator [Bradyrhizobium sp.]HLZ01762.1 helix-turn-helix transcriptional regulator [Bradyrhizobium sp.]